MKHIAVLDVVIGITTAVCVVAILTIIRRFLRAILWVN